MKLEKGDKYLKGSMDLGILGKYDVLVFENKTRKNDKQPTHKLCVKINGKLKKIGSLWLHQKR